MNGRPEESHPLFILVRAILYLIIYCTWGLALVAGLLFLMVVMYASHIYHRVESGAAILDGFWLAGVFIFRPWGEFNPLRK